MTILIIYGIICGTCFVSITLFDRYFGPKGKWIDNVFLSLSPILNLIMILLMLWGLFKYLFLHLLRLINRALNIHE